MTYVIERVAGHQCNRRLLRVVKHLNRGRIDGHQLLHNKCLGAICRCQRYLIAELDIFQNPEITVAMSGNPKVALVMPGHGGPFDAGNPPVHVQIGRAVVDGQLEIEPWNFEDAQHRTGLPGQTRSERCYPT